MSSPDVKQVPPDHSTISYVNYSAELFDSYVRNPLTNFYQETKLSEKIETIALKAFPFFVACYTNHPVVVIGLLGIMALNVTHKDFMTNQRVKDIFHGVAAAYFLAVLPPLAEVAKGLVIGGSLLLFAYKYDTVVHGFRSFCESTKTVSRGSKDTRGETSQLDKSRVENSQSSNRQEEPLRYGMYATEHEERKQSW